MGLSVVALLWTYLGRTFLPRWVCKELFGAHYDNVLGVKINIFLGSAPWQSHSMKPSPIFVLVVELVVVELEGSPWNLLNIQPTRNSMWLEAFGMLL